MKKDVKDLDVTDKAIELIKSHEGLYSTSPTQLKMASKGHTGFIYAYKDPVNIPTIGYGHTSGVFMNQKITMKQVNDFLNQDLNNAANGVKNLVKVEITQNMFDALVSFVFNLGVGRLQSSTLLKKLNAGKYDEAAEQILRWNKAGGQILAGLTKRRQDEYNLFLA